jgi:rhodanese-related sulfurtransferase
METGGLRGHRAAPEIDAAAVLVAGPEVIVLDVREPSEFATGSLPGARSLPAGEVRSRLYELPRGATVYLLCANGARSLDLVPFLRAVGYDAYSVAGGVWALQDHLVTTSSSEGVRDAHHHGT